MSQSPPSTLGKYQIIREIARSNDIVYEAWDPKMNRRVAVKELAMPGGSTPQQREDRINRFMREARAAGSLTHSNIMTVFEVGEENGRHFIAMEYLDGHTLRNEIDTKGFLPQDRAVEIGTAVLKGLFYAHEHGVIHRDIKPDNIQILSNGNIKITDFGIARLTFEPNLTQDGQVFGTPSYMSPEQIVGRDIDARSDLFSVGVMLYEMIAGQKPFFGDSVVAITYAIMNKEPDRPQQATFPVWQVIEKSLDKSPQLRYPDAAEMIHELEKAQRNVNPDPIGQSPQLGGTMIPPGQALPPIVNPYAQAQQGGYMPPQQPYGQQQIFLPPTNQPMAPVYAPPPTYNYSPYSNPSAGSAAPHTPTYQPPATPVYYPPPPRQPLFSPETRFFLGRLFLGVLVSGVIIMLVLGIISFFTGTGGAVGQKQDSGPIAEARKRYEAAPDGPDRDAAAHDLASQLERAGRDQLQSGDEQAGERNLLSAANYDPKLVSASVRLAEFYEQRAMNASPGDKVAALKKATEQWQIAADREIDPTRSTGYRERTAKSYLAVAKLLDSDRAQQRDLLDKALPYARNTSVSQAVQAFLQSLR